MPCIKLLFVCIAAVMLLCGCDTPKSGKPGSTDPASDQLDVTPSVDSEGQTDGGIIYDRCGFRLRLSESSQYNSLLTLEAENTTDKELTFTSVYIQDGDVLTSVSQSVYLSVDPKSTEKTELTLHKSMGTLKMKFYLLDEDLNYVEGSLSEQITISNHGKKELSGIPLGRPVYEDDKIKLIYTGAEYNGKNNRVRPSLYAINKTDSDLYLRSVSSECIHKDYRFSMNSYLPAGSQADITATASTSNATLSPSELDQAAFRLLVYNADDYIRNDDCEPIIDTKDPLIRIPKDGRPETEIPTEVTRAEAFEDYTARILRNREYTELPTPREGIGTKVLDGDVSLEYAAGYELVRNDNTYCYLCFKCTNRLSKQIAFSADGSINGFTSDFYSTASVAPMTETYISIYCEMPFVEIFGHCADVSLSVKARYDDGHFNEDSVISSVTDAEFSFGDRVDFSDKLKKYQPLLSDSSCELRLLGFKKIGSYMRALFFAQNKTPEKLTVMITPKDDRYSIMKRYFLEPDSYTVLDPMLFSSGTDSDEITIDDVKTLEFETKVE